MARLIVALVAASWGASVGLAADTRVVIPQDFSPLKARLVLGKATYTLDPGQQGAEFRKKLREAPAQAGRALIQPNIQIQAVPIPARRAVPLPPKARRAKKIPLRPDPAGKAPPKAQGESKRGESESEEEDATKAAEPAKTKTERAEDKKAEKKDGGDLDVKVEGEVQGVIIVDDGQGNRVVKDILPGDKPVRKEAAPARDEKGGAKSGEKKEGERAKDGEEDANGQGFRIQAQGGRIQIQGRIQMQGGVPGGPPQVQIFALGQGPQRPLPPEVDMQLEVRNTSGREMTLLVGRGRSEVELKLDGPGAMTVQGGLPAIVERPNEITLGPDKVHTIAIRRLQHGPNGGKGSYWTEPGEYTLTATFKAREKTESGETSPIEVTSPPVKIKVESK